MCDPTLRPLNAIIGYSIANFSSETFRYSETPFTQKMACINIQVNVKYYNLIYSLTERVPGISSLYIVYNLYGLLHDSVVDNKKKKRSTMKIVKRQTGPCTSANLTLSSCCKPFQDPTISCRVIDNNGESCYCDSLCFERNDCCNDAPVQAPCVPCK